MEESATLRTRGAATGRIALWWAGLGLFSGTLELAAFLLKCRWLDPRNYNVSDQFPWMFPVAGLIVVGLPALALIGLALANPRWVPDRTIATALSFPLALGLLFRAPILTAVCLLLAAGLSYRLGTYLCAPSRIPAFERMLKGWTACAGLALIGTFSLCHWGLPGGRTQPTPSPGERPRDVLLIVLDTVRARSLSLYGYDRPTTPNLARLARRGVTFDRAFSTAPWTAPSHASMFTGRWPNEISIGWDTPLERGPRTLAEEFASRGYSTAGFVANSTYCSYETGLSRGFAHYEDYDVTPRSILLCSSIAQRGLDFILKRPRLAESLGQGATANRHRKSAERICRDFLTWLDEHSPAPEDRPCFAFLNFFDAHHPYFPPEIVPGADFGEAADDLDEQHLIRTWWDADKSKLSPDQVALGRDAYDRCLAYLDREVGRLLDDLDRRGRLQSTLIVVTADHGEHLGERSLYGHGTSLYAEELHVPLLMIAPGLIPEGTRIATPVSLRDLAATMLDRVAPGRAHPFPGRSLAATWEGSGREISPVLAMIDGPPEGDPNHGRSPAAHGPLHSEVVWPFHEIRDRRGRRELYRLDRDPRGLTNLADHPESLAAVEDLKSRRR